MSLLVLSCRLERGLCRLTDLLREHEGRGRIPLPLLSGDKERRLLPPPLSRLIKLVCRLKRGGGGAPGLGESQVKLAETTCPVPKSPAGRKRWFSESFGFKKPSVKMFRSSERGGTSVSESGKSPSRQLRVDKHTQWVLSDSKSSGSACLRAPDLISKAVQMDFTLPQDNKRTQTPDPQVEHASVQAFDHEPYEGLLSQEEVVESLVIERFIGRGIKEKPLAKFESFGQMQTHSLTGYSIPSSDCERAICGREREDCGA